MIDLISRSELIENFRKCYSGHLGMENSDSSMKFHGICNVINNTNTVYDIDNVVEELKEWTFNADINVGDGTIMNHDLIVSKNAIEIVKQDDMADYVCEWEQDNMFEKVYRVCGGCFTSAYQKDFKFCPYCGKKIKVVE